MRIMNTGNTIGPYLMALRRVEDRREHVKTSSFCHCYTLHTYQLSQHYVSRSLITHAILRLRYIVFIEFSRMNNLPKLDKACYIFSDVF